MVAHHVISNMDLHPGYVRVLIRIYYKIRLYVIKEACELMTEIQGSGDTRHIGSKPSAIFFSLIFGCSLHYKAVSGSCIVRRIRNVESYSLSVSTEINQ